MRVRWLAVMCLATAMLGCAHALHVSRAEAALEKVFDDPCADAEAMTEEEALGRVARARATLRDAIARFQRGLPPGSIFLVVRTPRSRDYPDNPWAEEPEEFVVDEVSQSEVVGHHWSSTPAPERETFPMAEVFDWYIATPDGKVDGNWLGRCLESKDLEGTESTRDDAQPRAAADALARHAACW